MMQWPIHNNSTVLMKQKQHKVCWLESKRYVRMLRTLVVRLLTDAANVETGKFIKNIHLMKS